MELTSEEALQKGIEAQRAGQIQEADRLYTAILKAHPKHPDVNHNMGVLAVGVGKIQEALPFFKKAIESNGSIGQFWLSYINALMSLGLLSDAKAVLDQARDKGASGEAFDQLEQQLFGTSANQQDPPSHQLQPIINLCIQGQLQEALSYATEMLEGFPNSAILYNISGASYTGLMQFDSAIDSFNMALKIKPDYADACNNMGLALNNKGDPEAAIDSYIQALKIKPDYAEVYSNIANVMQSKGELDLAICNYKKAIKLKPSLEAAKVELIYQQSYVCDWDAMEDNIDVISSFSVSKEQVSPFAMLALDDSPLRNLKHAKLYSRNKYDQPISLSASYAVKKRRKKIL